MILDPLTSKQIKVHPSKAKELNREAIKKSINSLLIHTYYGLMHIGSLIQGSIVHVKDARSLEVPRLSI